MPVPWVSTVGQWAGLLRLKSVAEKTGLPIKGLSRHILDRRKDACLRYSTVPLTGPVFPRHYSATANPHPIGIR